MPARFHDQGGGTLGIDVLDVDDLEGDAEGEHLDETGEPFASADPLRSGVTGDHRLVFEDGRLNGRTLRDWLPEVVEDIVASVEPARIILFGSAARDEMGPDSDLDLLGGLDELDPADRAKLMGEIRFAIRAPVAIDVFVTDVDECERRRDVVGSMHYWPLREGEVVYERAA